MKVLGCLSVLLLSGCLTVKGAYMTLTAAETAVTQAREQFPAYDKSHRAEIVAHAKNEAAGVAALAEWNKTADAVTNAIAATHESVKTVKPLVAAVHGKSIDAYIAPVLQAALNLPKLLAAAGVGVK